MKTFAPKQKSPASFSPLQAKPRLNTLLPSLSGSHESTPFGQSRPLVQTKLTIGQPEDQYEQEADRVANMVTREPTPSTGQRQGTSGQGPGFLIQRIFAADRQPLRRQPAEEKEEKKEKKEEEEEEEELLQAKDLPGQPPHISPKLADRIKSFFGRGKPLPVSEQEYFEPRFGHDFSKVRIHTGADSADLARQLNAQAFTRGNDIFFGAGQYRPDTPQGRWLLAHELTHVVQQQPEPFSATLISKPLNFNLIRPGDTMENEADRAADLAENGRQIPLIIQPRPAGQTNNLIARRVNDRSAPEHLVSELESTSFVQELAEWILENLRIDPRDEAGIIRRSLADLAPATRSAVVAAVQSRLNPELAERVAALLARSDSAEIENPPEVAAPAPTTEVSPSPAPTGSAIASPPPATSAPTPTPATAAPAPEAEAPTAEAVPSPPPAAAEAEAPAEAPAAGAEIERAPASPEEDPAFQAVVARARGVAITERAHEPAEAKAAEAQEAAESPANEVASRAAERQVQEIDQQEPQPFDRAAFKTALLQRIATITPSTLKEADEFKKSGKLDSVKGQLTTQVEQGKEQAQGGIPEKVAEEPDTAGIEPKSVTPLPAAEAGPAPPDVGAAEAAPKPKTEAEVSLQEGSMSLDQKMAEAEVTEEQLQNSNEPEFQSALEAKRTAQADAAEAPQAYRQEEQATLGGAQSEAAAAAMTELEGMHGERAELLEQVLGQQTGSKTQDEQKRQEIASHIEEIYERTKQNVEQRLEQLDQDVNQRFDQGAAEAQQIFEDYVEQRMEAYKDERYSGVLGWGRWLKDKLLGMPPEVNAFYQEGKDLYLAKMDAVIDDIATIVETGLTEAKTEIANGKQEIKEFVESLPLELRDIGQEAAEKIESKFDDLEQTVDDKQNELIDALAQKYVENVQTLNARIEEMKAANRGLVDAALDAIGSVIETIINLKNMLLNVLARAAEAVSLIIKDPIGFLGNLVTGVKQGLQNFISKIGEHLQQGLMGWLLGAFAEAGIQLPEKFDLKGIFSLVMQILQLTYAAFRRRAVQLLGEDVVNRLEQVADVFKIFLTEGPAGVWEFIKERVGDLKAAVFDTIKSFVQEKIIIAGITWLIGLLNPAAAFIKAVKAIIDIVRFFIERGRQILELVNAVIDSITAIASGALDAAARFVENALAKAVPVVISFLAALLGLGGISQKIRSIIEKIRKPISKAIDWVINQAVKLVKKVGKLLGFGKKEEEAPETADPEHDLKVRAGLDAIDREEQKYLEDGKISWENAEKVALTVKRQHPVFKSITVVDGGETWDYEYVASPGKKKGKNKDEHRGRIQVQGKDLRSELSWPWTRDNPPTAQEAVLALNNLKSQLNASELSLRDEAFEKAERFIKQAGQSGGVSAPVSVTFQNRNLPPGNRDARVDIEVRKGNAFV